MSAASQPERRASLRQKPRASIERPKRRRVADRRRAGAHARETPRAESRGLVESLGVGGAVSSTARSCRARAPPRRRPASAPDDAARRARRCTSIFDTSAEGWSRAARSDLHRADAYRWSRRRAGHGRRRPRRRRRRARTTAPCRRQRRHEAPDAPQSTQSTRIRQARSSDSFARRGGDGGASSGNVAPVDRSAPAPCANFANDERTQWHVQRPPCARAVTSFARAQEANPHDARIASRRRKRRVARQHSAHEPARPMPRRSSRTMRHARRVVGATSSAGAARAEVAVLTRRAAAPPRVRSRQRICRTARARRAALARRRRARRWIDRIASRATRGRARPGPLVRRSSLSAPSWNSAGATSAWAACRTQALEVGATVELGREAESSGRLGRGSAVAAPADGDRERALHASWRSRRPSTRSPARLELAAQRCRPIASPRRRHSGRRRRAARRWRRRRSAEAAVAAAAGWGSGDAARAAAPERTCGERLRQRRRRVRASDASRRPPARRCRGAVEGLLEEGSYCAARRCRLQGA